MPYKIEFFTDTNMGNLEQAINDFLSSEVAVHSIQQSQSSYVIPADVNNHEAVSETVTNRNYISVLHGRKTTITTMQNILLPALANIAQHTRLKNSSAFNSVMFIHYRELYQKYRKGWHMISATLAWFKMNEYEKRMNECALTEMLNPYKDNYEQPTVLV